MEKFIINFFDFFHKYKPIFDRNHYENITTYDSECTEQFTKYPGTSISFSKECIKCMKYLKHLEDHGSDDDHKKQGIIYLYLWLYDYEVKNRIFNGKTISNFKSIMEIYENNSPVLANIYNIYTYYVENVLNDKLNDLYSLYEKFYNFQNNPECTDKCICAQECVDTYMKSLEKPNTNSNIYLCNELENFRKKYYEHKPSETECPRVQSYLPSCNKDSTSVIALISFITILVLSSLLFILYKFTPFGSRFRYRSKDPKEYIVISLMKKPIYYIQRGRAKHQKQSLTI